MTRDKSLQASCNIGNWNQDRFLCRHLELLNHAFSINVFSYLILVNCMKSEYLTLTTVSPNVDLLSWFVGKPELGIDERHGEALTIIFWLTAALLHMFTFSDSWVNCAGEWGGHWCGAPTLVTIWWSCPHTWDTGAVVRRSGSSMNMWKHMSWVLVSMHRETILTNVLRTRGF